MIRVVKCPWKRIMIACEVFRLVSNLNVWHTKFKAKCLGLTKIGPNGAFSRKLRTLT